MQLVDTYSDIERVANLLNPAYKEKLLQDINLLIGKYMDEQMKNPDPIQNNEKPQLETANQQAPPPPPPDRSAGVNALKGSFKSNNSNFPPPPPPPNLSQGPSVGRAVSVGNFAMKNISPRANPNTKASISILEVLGYMIPYITEFGQDILNKPSTPTDTYQFLKQLDGQANLKQIYMYLYPDMAWGKYLEKIYPLAKERYYNLHKSRDFPKDSEVLIRIGDLMISFDMLSPENLEKALQEQKNPSVSKPSGSAGWLDKTMAMLPDNKSSSETKRKLLGDTLVEMNLISKDQLNYVLGIQKWLKTLIER